MPYLKLVDSIEGICNRESRLVNYMKNKILQLILVVLPIIGSAQSDSINSTLEVFEKVEVMPEFPGGINAMFKFLGENIKFSKDSDGHRISGRVVMEYVIAKDGSLTNFKAIESTNPILTEEAIRVLKSMPKWNPGRIKGEPVLVSFRIPFNFISDEKPKESNNRTKGVKCYKEGKYESSIYYLSKIIKVNKKDPMLFYYRGVSYDKEGKTKKAIKDLEKAKELGSKEAEGYLKTIQE